MKIHTLSNYLQWPAERLSGQVKIWVIDSKKLSFSCSSLKNAVQSVCNVAKAVFYLAAFIFSGLLAIPCLGLWVCGRMIAPSAKPSENKREPKPLPSSSPTQANQVDLVKFYQDKIAEMGRDQKFPNSNACETRLTYLENLSKRIQSHETLELEQKAVLQEKIEDLRVLPADILKRKQTLSKCRETLKKITAMLQNPIQNLTELVTAQTLLDEVRSSSTTSNLPQKDLGEIHSQIYQASMQINQVDLIQSYQGKIDEMERKQDFPDSNACTTRLNNLNELSQEIQSHKTLELEQKPVLQENTDFFEQFQNKLDKLKKTKHPSVRFLQSCYVLIQSSSGLVSDSLIEEMDTELKKHTLAPNLIPKTQNELANNKNPLATQSSQGPQHTPRSSQKERTGLNTRLNIRETPLEPNKYTSKTTQLRTNNEDTGSDNDEFMYPTEMKDIIN